MRGKGSGSGLGLSLSRTSAALLSVKKPIVQVLHRDLFEPEIDLVFIFSYWIPGWGDEMV